MITMLKSENNVSRFIVTNIVYFNRSTAIHDYNKRKLECDCGNEVQSGHVSEKFAVLKVYKEN